MTDTSPFDTLKNILSGGGDPAKILADIKAHLGLPAATGGIVPPGAPGAQAKTFITGADRFVTVISTVLPVAAAFDPDPTSKAILLALVPVVQALHAFNAAIEAGSDPGAALAAILASVKGIKTVAAPAT